MKKSRKSKLDFIPNKLNKYSIRKFTVGTASILIGSLMFLGNSVEADAAVGDTTTPSTTSATPTTEAPTTATPTTEAPTTATPTTEVPTTVAPTTEAPTAATSTTEAPTTEAPATTPEKATNVKFNADNSVLTGSATAGQTVELTLANGTVEKAVVDANGTFTFNNLNVGSGEIVKVLTVDGQLKSAPVEVTANIITPSTEAPTTETATTEAPTTEASTTEAPTTESATTEAATTEAPTTEAATTATPSTEAPTTTSVDTAAVTVDQTTAKLNTLTTVDEKKAALSDYLAQNTGTTQAEAVAQIDALNLDYANLTSDELMAALLQAIASKQEATTVVATPVATRNSLTNMKSITLDANAPINGLVASTSAGDSTLTVDGVNVIESAAFNSTTQHTVNGKIVQQWSGNPLEFNNPKVATPLAGVRVFAQWIEKSGEASPIYTTVTMPDGTYHIVMQDFTKADGTTAKFDADPNLPEGEKWRIWAATPAGLQLYYSWENSQLGPQSAVMDTAYNASYALGPDQLNNFNFIYVPKTDTATMHDMANATPAIQAPGESGFIKGTVFWNNNVNQGTQTMATTVTNSGGTTDTPATNITVVGSYLSDYALQQIYAKAPAAIGTTNIRGIGWDDTKEQALQNWIKQQIAAEGTALWIAETVTTTTDAKGNYNLQFNGTYGKEWNDRGFNGALLDSATNSNTVLPDALAISEGLPIGSTYADLFNHVASSPQIGSWYGDTSAGVNAMTIDAAPKHVNLDWTYVSLQGVDSYGFASPYYGNKFLFDNADTSWTTFNKIDAVADQYITGADFGLFLDQMNFDVVNFNTNTTPASPGNTVTTNTVGLPSSDLGNNLYQIVWFDKNGNEVSASPVEAPSTTGTLPSADFLVPTTALDGDVYTAKVFAINPTDKTTRGAYPLAVDSFVVKVTDASVNQPDYVDTPVEPGTTVSIAAPLNADGSVPPAKSYAPADPATLPAWAVVNADGTITASPDATIPAGPVTVPIEVTYLDGSKEVIDVIITVGTTDAVDNQPEYINTTVEPGTTKTIAAPLNADGTSLPTGTTYSPANASTLPSWAVVNPDGTITVKPDATVPAGAVTIPVTVTYP
ncbi:Rib/alpha-like domain-containing protein, partial [Macrococcus capreoli]